MEIHSIKPYYNKDSKILILGSFPSIKSREAHFYYAHPQNRFWQVLGIVFKENIADDIKNKKAFLKKHLIALYDVCKSCEINGSSDASLKIIEANDLTEILNNSAITQIYVNGFTAYKLYNKFIKPQINKEAVYLPSTSSANAKYQLEDLVNVYRVLNTK